MRIPVLLLSVSVLPGCSNPINWFMPYTMEIQQGNYITQEMVSQLKPGMTKDQVRFALGTPLLTDIFHADRWDYVFTRRLQSSRKVEERRLTVYFKDGRLEHVDGDVVPGETGASAAKE